MDRQFRERFAVQFDLLFTECSDEPGVRDALGAECCIETDDPEGAEIALFQTAIAVGVLSCFDDRFIGFHERRAAHVAVPFREGTNLLVTPMSDDASFDAHD